MTTEKQAQEGQGYKALALLLFWEYAGTLQALDCGPTLGLPQVT